MRRRERHRGNCWKWCGHTAARNTPRHWKISFRNGRGKRQTFLRSRPVYRQEKKKAIGTFERNGGPGRRAGLTSQQKSGSTPPSPKPPSFVDTPERRGRRRAERNLGGLLAVQPKTGPLRQRPGLQDATVGKASPAAGGIPLPGATGHFVPGEKCHGTLPAMFTGQKNRTRATRPGETGSTRDTPERRGRPGGISRTIWRLWADAGCAMRHLRGPVRFRPPPNARLGEPTKRPGGGR